MEHGCAYSFVEAPTTSETTAAAAAVAHLRDTTYIFYYISVRTRNFSESSVQHPSYSSRKRVGRGKNNTAQDPPVVVVQPQQQQQQQRQQTQPQPQQAAAGSAATAAAAAAAGEAEAAVEAEATKDAENTSEHLRIQ